MTDGRYHVSEYDRYEYDFIGLISDFFGVEQLNELHHTSDKKYQKLFEVGKDSSTDFHTLFYDKYRKGWGEMQSLYDFFIKTVISKRFKEDFLYQSFPTFRVHLPYNVAVGAFHNDAEFHHPAGEVNYILPLTDSDDTASVWVESKPGKEDFIPMEMRTGQLIEFDGNRLTHGNKPNQTDKTRVSIDFRVLPISCYNEADMSHSITTSKKFTEGAYYTRFSK